jgi:DNA repair exonuclease SbcCD ATPase subunit
MKLIKVVKRRSKQTVRFLKRGARKLRKSAYTRDRKVWAGAALVLLVAVFWALPTYAAKAPGQLGYGIKRGEEVLIANLAPLPSWREDFRLEFANNRVLEAAYVADHANQSHANNPVKTAATINGLLGTFENVYEARTASLNQKLTDRKKISKADATEFRKDAIGTYDELQLLRVQAPGGAQLAVLTSINDVQQNIAALNDNLGIKPLSAGDLLRLSKLVTIGVMTKAQVDQLAAATSNRQLHTQLVSMIENGQLPSDITYQLDEDLIKQVEPENAKSFDAVSEFEQMQRISAVVAASRPTTAQKQVIQAYLRSYQPGQTVPADNQQYVAPVVYGIALSGRLLNDLRSLSGVHMSSDNQQLFNKWKAIVDPPNLSDIYQRLTTAAQDQPQLSLRSMTRMQQELVAAQQAQVSYLVMPPGWGTAQLGKLNTQMGVQIATEQFEASKPDANRALAGITVTQQQLQTRLDALEANHSETITKLQTQVNDFSGTPEQLAQLKSDLAALDAAQTITINNVQTQLTNITNAHTALGDSIENLRQEQLTNLTELELRAATHAQQLTDSAKAELTTTLNQIDSRSQTLVTNLETRIDNLGSSHNQLRSELTTEITTIKANYQVLTASVQAQLDAGVATTNQLQATLTQVQSTIAGEQTKVNNLISSTTALSQLVNQVKTDTTNQVQDLQDQIDVVKLDQQTTNAAVSDLQSISQTSQSLITGLQDQVDALGTGQTQLRAELTGQIQTVQDNYTALAAYTQAQLDAGVATTTQLQTDLQSVQTSLAQHATQLTSLSTSTTALTQLVSQVQADSTAQVSGLQDQVDSLAISQQTVETSLDTLRDQQTADVAQLAGQLAGLSVLQAEAQAAITALNQQQTEAQATIDNLTTDFNTLQAAFDASEQVQTAMQSNLADQQSALDSLQTQTQASIDTLTQQQTQLVAQIDDLAANVTTLSQTLATLQTTSTATQTQLDTLLANPPWAIPVGTYVTQSEFDTLSAQLDAEFAAKAAALDAQFQAYQQTLNASVSQLNSQVQSLSTTTTNTATAQTQQQTQINTLSSQIQTLQTQVQQLINATTPPGGL